MLIFSQPQLEAVLTEYVDHYNGHRPHRSLEQRAPLSRGRRCYRQPRLLVRGNCEDRVVSVVSFMSTNWLREMHG